MHGRRKVVRGLRPPATAVTAITGAGGRGRVVVEVISGTTHGLLGGLAQSVKVISRASGGVRTERLNGVEVTLTVGAGGQDGDYGTAAAKAQIARPTGLGRPSSVSPVAIVAKKLGQHVHCCM